MSEETCSDDRLGCRTNAATDYLEGLTPEEMLDLEAEKDEFNQTAMDEWNSSDSVQRLEEVITSEEQAR